LFSVICGRYVRRSDKQKIAELFAIHGPLIPDFGPAWNIAPQTLQPVVRLNRDTGKREIVLIRWGLVPFWSKDPRIGLRTINAKAETITTAPTFREAIKYRRCLVPANAFLMAEAGCKNQAAVRHCSKEQRALRIRRALGEMEGSESRNGASDIHGHHHRPE
jgi:putative SOS response-associated peptidase YedK